MKHLASLVLGATLVTGLSGCESSLEDISTYDYENACVVVPDLDDFGPQPIFTNGPIYDAATLSAGITFDDSERLTGDLPGPATGSGLSFSNISVTDKSLQNLFVRGSVPDGKRIGAVFVGIVGTDEYFAIPIAVGGPTGASTGEPVLINLRGPFPVEGSDPEPDQIITVDNLLTQLEVKAFLVDAGAEPPDVTTVFDGAADDANWLLPSTAPTLTGRIVGTGAFTTTLFWNTDETDIDLEMIEPDSNRIYYAAKNSLIGDGFLDVDNTQGFGPENIFFTEDIPQGLYQIQVRYFPDIDENDPATNWSVSVTACGSTRAFTGVLSAETELDPVFSFVYGENCSIEPVVTPPKQPSLFEQAVVCDPDALQTLVPEDEE